MTLLKIKKKKNWKCLNKP